MAIIHLQKCLLAKDPPRISTSLPKVYIKLQVSIKVGFEHHISGVGGDHWVQSNPWFLQLFTHHEMRVSNNWLADGRMYVKSGLYFELWSC